MLNPQEIQEFLDKHLCEFNYPESYLGDEPGVISQDWVSRPRCLVLGADGYPALAGNLAVPLITQLINRTTSGLAQRAFYPDCEKALRLFRKHGIPVFSLEEKRPISDYDIVFVSVCYAPRDLNVIRMLHMSGIPVKAKDRTAQHPLIIRGGEALHHADTIVDLYDVVAFGDGEVLIPGIIKAWDEVAGPGFPRDKVVKALTQVKGCYSSLFNKEVYSDSGVLQGWEGEGETVEYARELDMANCFINDVPIMSYVDTGMSAGSLLISRGCAAGCSFCAEGWTNRPYRELPLDRVTKGLSQVTRQSGAIVPLISAFCSSTYSQRKHLVVGLMKEFEGVDFISQRVDETAADRPFVDLTRVCGNKTVSLGVESCTEAGRRRVNKHCTDEQIVKAAEWFMRAGYMKIKFFMILDLPEETEQDWDGILPVARKIADLKAVTGSTAQTMFSFTPFVGMHLTPYQWIECKGRIGNVGPLLKKLKAMGHRSRIGGGGNWLFEQLIQRGDRRLTDLWMQVALDPEACGFTMVKRNFDEVAAKYLADHGLSLDTYFAARAKSDVLPSDFIYPGYDRDYLWRRYLESLACQESAKCTEKCESCGVCQPKQLVPALWKDEPDDVDTSRLAPRSDKVKSVLRLEFQLQDQQRYLSAQAIRFIIRRALYQVGYPFIPSKVKVGSSSLQGRDWANGSELAEVGLTVEAIMAMGSDHFAANHLTLVSHELADRFTLRSGVSLYCVYRVDMPQVPAEDLDRLVEEYWNAPVLNIDEATREEKRRHPALVVVTAHMGNVTVDTREHVHGVVPRPEDGTVMLAMRPRVSPAQVVERLFRVRAGWNRTAIVNREGYYVKMGQTLFTPRCPKCNSFVSVARNIMPKRTEEVLCLKCLTRVK